MDLSQPVITIDGPGGSGKGTLARRIAEYYGFHLLDSGALYRITALEASRLGVSPSDESAIVEVSKGLEILFAVEGAEGVAVYLDGVDVTQDIRTEECGSLASQIAPLPGLRAALLDVQRDFQREPGLVADGRDMGTVVFPSAAVKIFLTASAEARAKRRHLQLKARGIESRIADLLLEIQARDERDQNRSVSPLIPAEDANQLDSTTLSIEEVEARIVQIVANTLPTLARV
ncbi:MAG: (d)CMP kinase [Pseudomonadota bacterium]